MYRKTSSINRQVYWLLGMVLLLLTSCDYTFLRNRISDGGILSGKPCPAPCFWEIRPGETTKAQAIEILRGKGAISYHQTNKFVFYGDAILFEYDSNVIVNRIGFVPNTAITVQALIAKYGNPDAVAVTYDPSSTPEHDTIFAGLYYDSLHTSVNLDKLYDTWPPIYHVSQETRITFVTYFSDSYYETWKASEIDHISKWNGYGAYEDSH
jgi:hypothetical protein